MRLYSTDRPDREGAETLSGTGAVTASRDNPLLIRKQRIRVLHIAETIAGGIASFFEEIAAYQNEAFGRGNVTFLVPAGSEMHLPSIDPAQIVTFAPGGRRPGALLKFASSARDAIRRLNPDIVHLHSTFAGAVVRAFLPRAEKMPRVIYCPHGWAFGIECSKAKKRAYAAVERLLSARTDSIIVNSGSEFELAVQFGLPPHKLKLVKNGIAWTDPPPRRRRAGKMHLAFIGRHDRQKGVDILFETIERFSLPDIEFHIVGESVLSRNRSRTPERPNISFHGWLDRAEVMELLCDMDAVVMPSRWEAFGLVAIESMRAGVPVIGSNRGALPEIVRDGIDGYIFDVDDADALGRLLERLDPAELRIRGGAARARWESEFVADRMNELTREAYEGVLARAGGHHNAEPAVDSETPPPVTWQLSR